MVIRASEHENSKSKGFCEKRRIKTAYILNLYNNILTASVISILQKVVMSTNVESNMPLTEKQHENHHKKVKRVRSSPIDLLVWEYTNSLDRANTFEKLKEATKHFDIDEICGSGLNALQQCALDGNLEGLKLLLSLGADCNKRGRCGWTALHYAASEGYLEIVRHLMKHGANVRIADDNQKFPVEITEDESVLKLLFPATILSTDILLPSSSEHGHTYQHKASV